MTTKPAHKIDFRKAFKQAIEDMSLNLQCEGFATVVSIQTEKAPWEGRIMILQGFGMPEETVIKITCAES